MTSIYFQNTFQRSFGTFPLKGEALRNALRVAVETGYRAFDTAQSYGNEADIGAALQELGVDRKDLCITTKVRPENFGADTFIASVEKSLADLRIDSVDVLLLHWPPPGGDIGPSLTLLQQARERGLARNIGVSNYTSAMMRRAATMANGPIATNQVEFHPLLDQRILLQTANETGIPLSSYCSAARGAIDDAPLIRELATEYGVSSAQIALRWILQKGVAINTMSTKPEHIRRNFDVMGFTLSSVDMARLDALGATGLRIVTRAATPFAPEWDA